MNVKAIKPKIHVITGPEHPCSILAVKEFLQNRKSGQGVVWKPVEGYRNAWWVRHTDYSVAPYWYFELTEDPNPPEEASNH